MIYSMTAYARASAEGEWGSAVWELRSVNHRFLELSFRLPDALRELEMTLREKAKILSRGKIECQLKFTPGEFTETQLNINQGLLKQLVNAAQEIKNLLASNTAPINITEILAWPGLLQMEQRALTEVKAVIVELFEKAMSELMAVRAREGNAIENLFTPRLQAIQSEVSKVKIRLPEVLTNQREKLIERLSTVKKELDSERLEQEMVLFAQKLDVTEEVDRLDTHVNEFERILKEGGSVGRRLDFLLQEFNREANTLSAKVCDTQVTQSAVELKVLIEQLREQVQNLA